MRKLKMPKQELNNFEDVFHIFETSQNAKCVSQTTLNNYKYNLKNISKYHNIKKDEREFFKINSSDTLTSFSESNIIYVVILLTERERECGLWL